jgi:hypothetical protein
MSSREAFNRWYKQTQKLTPDPDIYYESYIAWQAWQAAQEYDVDKAAGLMTVPVRLAPTSYHIIALKAAKAGLTVEAFIIRAAMEAKA